MIKRKETLDEIDYNRVGKNEKTNYKRDTQEREEI